MNTLKYILLADLLLVVFWFLHLYFFAKKHALPADAEAVIVFSHGLNEKGDLSLETISRLKKGLEVMKTTNAQKIIVTGGASIKMKEWLLLQGVRLHKIIDVKSFDTVSNLLYAKDILERENITKIVCVSETLHLYRIALICTKLKLKSSFAASPNTMSVLGAYQYLHTDLISTILIKSMKIGRYISLINFIRYEKKNYEV